MATYEELFNLSFDDTLRARVTAACAIAAETVRTEDPATENHVNRVTWAISTLANPDGRARQIIWLLLASNASLTVAQIQGATDAQIQAAVNNALAFMVSV